MNTLHTIFPTTILHTGIDRNFTIEELEFIKEQEKNYIVNLGNIQTTNKYILNFPQMCDIKNIILKKLEFYFREVLCVDDNLNVYLTQSWLNYSYTGGYHHLHSHPNSFLSGVLYIQAEAEKDKIVFISQNSILDNGFFKIFEQAKEENIYNAPSWFFPVKTGEIIIFPSTLEHHVPKTESENVRISLAFNAFLKGKMGSVREATELFL
jgi:uncharacterized protein (TIGR02466 family)